MRLARPAALFALLAVAAATRGQAPTTAPSAAPAAAGPMVENPAYAAWAKCPPGTVVEQTVSRTREGRTFSATTATTLVAVTPDAVKLEQALTMEGAPPQKQSADVPAKLPEATVNVTNMPGLSRKEVGREDVSVDGKSYACRIFEIAGTANGTAVSVRSWESLDFPGNMVRTHAKMGEAAETKIEGTKVTRPK